MKRPYIALLKERESFIFNVVSINISLLTEREPKRTKTCETRRLSKHRAFDQAHPARPANIFAATSFRSFAQTVAVMPVGSIFGLNSTMSAPIMRASTD